MKNDIDLEWWVELLLIMGVVLFIGVIACDMALGAPLEDVEAFLVNDTTDSHEWLPYYSCGHFARDLSRNASQLNISISSAILGNNPVLRGHSNHIVNYIIDNNTVYLIEPQTDEIFLLNQSGYRFYRLYPNGDQVPSYWVHNFATEWIDLSPVFKRSE